MIEIFWLLKRTKKDLKTKNNLAEEKNEQKWPNKIIIQILVPSLTVLFIMIYFGSAVVFSSL
jgi:high-affinity K+ transport system ATPase subunit B